MYDEIAAPTRGLATAFHCVRRARINGAATLDVGRSEMASSKRERQRANRASGRPMRIVVMTYPSSTIESVLPLVRSAVLYGDEVVLHSPLASFIASLGAVANGSVRDLVKLVIDLGASHVPKFQAMLDQIEAEHPGNGVELITQMLDRGSALRTRGRSQLEGIDLSSLDASLAEMRRVVVETSEEQLAEQRFDLIHSAVDAGVLRIAPFGLDEMEDIESSFMRSLDQLLGEPNVYPVFDENLSGFLGMLSRHDRLDVTQSVIDRSTQATTADRFLASLPTFPLATMDEIVGIRAELRSPLTRFRAAMITISRDLGVTPLDAGYEDAVEDVWRASVAPSLDELDELANQGGLFRTYGIELVAGVTSTAMTVGVATVGNMAGAVAAAAPTVGAVITALRKGADHRAAKRAAAIGNPYYFLHRTDAALRQGR